MRRLEVTQLEAARVFGVGPRTVRRWAAGEARVPHAVNLLLLLLEDRRIRLAELEA